MSSDWCYPLCALVTLVLRLIRFDNPCRLSTEMVALVRVIRLVHVLLPVPYTSKSGTCPLNPRHETAYHRCGFRDSVDPDMVRYRRCSGCHPDPTSTSSSLSSKSRAGLRFQEGEEEPVPHGQCFMPVRVPFGIGGWSIIVLPSLSNFRI